MKKTDEPGWPAPGGFPFLPFLQPPKPAAAQPASLLQGMSGGIDLWKDFWNQLPGAAPIPGFLLPTVDVGELDKRIGDLRAAEQWVEVNLNLLRTTIQGLEVQRNTIAALHSLSTFAERPDAVPPFTTSPPKTAQAAEQSVPPSPTTAATAPPDAPAPPALAAGNWLAYLQDQFAKVAGAAIGTSETSAPAPVAAKKPAVGKRPSAPARKRRKAPKAPA